jgi:hypothetical protein
VYLILVEKSRIFGKMEKMENFACEEMSVVCLLLAASMPGKRKI